MQKIALAVAMLLAVVGCATTSTGAMEAGPDTYVLSRTGGAYPGTSADPLLGEALSEARAKCGSMSKQMQMISSAENQGPYIMGNKPKVTITFTCK